MVYGDSIRRNAEMKKILYGFKEKMKIEFFTVFIPDYTQVFEFCQQREFEMLGISFILPRHSNHEQKHGSIHLYISE